MSRRQEFLDALNTLNQQFPGVPQRPEPAYTLPFRMPTLKPRDVGSGQPSITPRVQLLESTPVPQVSWTDRFRQLQDEYTKFEALPLSGKIDSIRQFMTTPIVHMGLRKTPDLPEAEQQFAQWQKDYQALPAAQKPQAALDQFGKVIGPPLGFTPEYVAELQRRNMKIAVLPFAPGGGEAFTAGSAKALPAKFAKFAEAYPETPEYFTWDWKPKEQEWAPSRSTTPETEAFTKERLRINKQMGKEGFEPYFDPEKRYHAKVPKSEGPADVYTEGMPKTQDTINKWRKEIQTPGARNRLQAAYNEGVRTGGHDRWYMMGQLQKAFIDELGPKAGRARFLEWTRSMAATTSGADPETNLITAQYGRYLRERNLPIPKHWETGKPTGIFMPPPTRGERLGSNLGMFDRFINKGEAIDETFPKRAAFAGNLSGFTNVPTIDEQMTKVISPDLGISAPKGDSYFAYAELVREMAAKNKVSVDEFQAIVWGGAKSLKTKGKYVGKPMIQVINEAIERTSRLTGMPQKEVLRRGIIRGEIPVYGLVGAVGAGAAAAGAGAGGKTNQQ